MATEKVIVFGYDLGAAAIVLSYDLRCWIDCVYVAADLRGDAAAELDVDGAVELRDAVAARRGLVARGAGQGVGHLALLVDRLEPNIGRQRYPIAVSGAAVPRATLPAQ